jgi:hypothetical protein
MYWQTSYQSRCIHKNRVVAFKRIGNNRGTQQKPQSKSSMALGATEETATAFEATPSASSFRAMSRPIDWPMTIGRSSEATVTRSCHRFRRGAALQDPPADCPATPWDHPHVEATQVPCNRSRWRSNTGSTFPISWVLEHTVYEYYRLHLHSVGGGRTVTIQGLAPTIASARPSTRLIAMKSAMPVRAPPRRRGW